MKKLVCLLTLLLGASQAAHAQVYFAPGSARPINPGAATRDLDHPRHARPRAKGQRVLVCRDGSRHIASICRRHGGIR
ncbi:MAG TPA: hypothetical protein DCW29_06340 [Janthinobacterium sp.]|nr:hypothetical protein [Janthinobacterium sp.]